MLSIMRPCDSCATLLELISLIHSTNLSIMMNAYSLCAGSFQGSCQCTQSFNCVVQSSV